MKLKFHSDDDLPIKEKLEFRNVIIVVRTAFRESTRYYSQTFVNECLYKS